MAQKHYNVLDNGVHARIAHDHGHAKKEQSGFEAQQGCRYGIKSSCFLEIDSPAVFQGQMRSGRRAQRGGKQSNWAKNEPGMRAIFLGPKTKSCGTGVFIPRGQGTDLQSTNKPAFSPVLLPSRVIQALNLNVHELGPYIRPQSELNKKCAEKIDENLQNQKEDYVSSSPEIFLPKEWTY